MPMMRRGPLDQYSAEWVLRQANASHASGSVEFHSERPITLYLRSGRVCHAAEGVPVSGLTSEYRSDTSDELAARTRTVELLARALAAKDGWYYHDPLGSNDDAGPWQWEGASLIMDARIHLHDQTRARAAAEAPPTEPVVSEAGPTEVATSATRTAMDLPTIEPRKVELRRTADEAPITLGADAWAIVCALAVATEAETIGRRMSWPADRLAAALADLDAAGAIRPVVTAPPRRADAPLPLTRAAEIAAGAAAATAADPAPPSPASSAPHATTASPAPLEQVTDPPAPSPAAVPTAPARAAASPIDDRRGALRRLISVLKPA